jgi:DNA-binding CsgD family transcriptional regulator/tetratricopeptide (TPR) repeat protein
MDRLDAEIDNLRAALEWALHTRRETALMLSAALGWFWWGRDYHSEGRRWLGRSLATSSEPSAVRMKALHMAGWLAHHQRDLIEARELLQQSLAIADAVEDDATVAWVLHCLGRVADFDRDPDTARSLGEQSLAVADRVGEPAFIAWAHHLLGLAAYIAGDNARARLHYSRSLAIRRELGFQEGIGILTILLGLVAVREGDMAEALELYREGLSIVRDVLGPWGVAMPLAALSHIAAAQGHAVQAARLAAAATHLGDLYQTPLIPLVEPLLADGLERAHKALGDERFDEARAEGRQLSLDAAIAEALAVELGSAIESTHTGNDVPRGSFGKLTSTEMQVLRLLVGGNTSREIATELVIAVSTVDRHLTHIYSKLGARNRAEATAKALQHCLVTATG